MRSALISLLSFRSLRHLSRWSLPSWGLRGAVAAAALLLALPLPVLAPAAQAQTPAATVKDDGSGSVVFQSFKDGGLLALEQGATSGDIPAEGAGARMMWYPGKAAFRVGEVGVSDFSSGEEWNDANVGVYSVAFGRNTEASGSDATATGSGTIASGSESTAMGDGTTASGSGSTAMGNGPTASGIGATAMGNGTTASAVGATAMGQNATASAPIATAMGAGTTASNSFATAMGFDTEASAYISMAMGERTTASGRAATALGVATEAATERSLSLGQCNSSNQPSGDGTLVVVGNGSYDRPNNQCGSRSDALELDDQGNLTISGSLTEGSDRRLKTGIEPLGDGAIEALQKIDPVRYRFKDQRAHPSGQQIGLVAQDVRKEFPTLVSEGSGGMLSLAYPKLTAVLLKGLQEQQATIEKQQSRLEKQQSTIEAQQEQLEALEAENENIKERLVALEEERSTARPAGLVGPWGLAFLLGLGGLGAGLLWRRQR